MRIAIAQINLLVGDIDGNCDRILHWSELARTQQRAGLVIFPELALVGYPPDDLLLRPALHDRVRRALKRITAAAGDIDIIVGYPEQADNRLYNSCAWLRRGALYRNYRKQNLPNYGVFDEKRHFISHEALALGEIGGIPVSPSVCEDLWTPDQARCSSAAGAKLLININASPFHAGKYEERAALLEMRVRETGMAIIYANLVGGQDEVVFDGASIAMDGAGRLILTAPHFSEGLHCLELGADKGAVTLHADMPPEPPPSQDARCYGALVLGVRDYARKNRFRGAVLGLSGGIDSALTLCITVDALGAENVEALAMPSRHTADISNHDAELLAARLGVRCRRISIEEPARAFSGALAPLFAGLPPDVTEENIQARCRGVLLMAVSNKSGRLVLATGNKSELSVGYATLYGDMAGGFAPLKDVFKTQVYRLAEHVNRAGEIIPRRTIERPPTAELRPDQKDEDTLPPYSVLDPILERYIEQQQNPGKIIAAGFDPATVRRVVRMVDGSEYKRRQAAPGVKVSQRAFGRDRRYPITSGYAED
ncbi:MAG: NAD+ synthase [Gammaproteobacteria bacterium]|nr:NAD+ synthase [Gammaproteobacteria bacterium]